MKEINCYYCSNLNDDYCAKHKMFTYEINKINSKIDKRSCFEGEDTKEL